MRSRASEPGAYDHSARRAQEVLAAPIVLIWINLMLRRDLGLIAKLTWAVVAIVPFVPFVYVLTGNNFI